MIVKPEQKREKTALQLIEEAPFDFYQVGSRYFGNTKLNSDFDFAVEDSSEVRQYLIENGFEIWDGEYLDGLCNAVAEKEDVDIQLRSNVKYYMEVLDKVPPTIAFAIRNIFDKTERALFWNMLFTLYGEKKND